jgi:serine/threonine protein phosphatase 1
MIDLVPAPAVLPPGQRVYAVGDVHGCLDRLQSVHEQIAADIAARPIGLSVLVHLGDYVDRGPESAGVIDLLAKGASAGATHVVNLMGNHEQMMLSAIAGVNEEPGNLWLSNGGADSLLSWNVPRLATYREWANLIPLHHLVFLRDLRLHHRVGPYMFVHAGIRPGSPSDQQKREDLLWIRTAIRRSRSPSCGQIGSVSIRVR